MGVYSSVTEIAEGEKISKSYVSRILRLALLAPDIVLAILGGWADQRVMLPCEIHEPHRIASNSVQARSNLAKFSAV